MARKSNSEEAQKSASRFLEAVNYLINNAIANSEREISIEIGLSSAYCSSIRQGKFGPSTRAKRQLTERYPISYTYISNGIGSIFTSPRPKQTRLASFDPIIENDDKSGLPKEFVFRIPYFENLSAFASWVDSDATMKKLHADLRMWVGGKNDASILERCATMPVRGDSMSPTYEHGDDILFYEIDPSKFLYLRRAVYIFVTEVGAFLKRIHANTWETGKIVLHSDAEGYPPRELETSQITSVWQIYKHIKTPEY